ncbi:MAG: GNAT family N-acetyltransferase [Bacilli bacterium]|jgi:GNAT superfamily N-acetyltransferase|nr:GNAT family N-acetyltransferase [Bacilli bacterium]MDY0063495.1 GNAT family N-acetyltransferase [Bacilli bacterium]
MIEIREVKTKKQLRQFVEFPIKLYKDCPYYVPPIAADEMGMFNPKTNPAYEFCKTRLFLAYKDSKLVGRIAGLINYAYNKKVNKELIRFTRYDVIDDIEVSRALIEKVKEFGKEYGLRAMMGPIGFTDIDKQGMLVEGFDEMNLSITIYNYEYYHQHLETLGFVKDADWVEYQIGIPEKMDPRIERVSALVEKRYGFHRIHIKKNKDLYPYALEAFQVVNEAFAKLYGVVPLTDKIIEKSIKEYVPLVNLDYVFVIGDKEGKVIGFGLMLPSIAMALKKSNGHLFPFGLLRMLHALKTSDILEMYFIAVKPEFQNMGVNALIISEAIKACMKNNAKFAETGPELENNNSVQDQWKSFQARQHRRRRCYILPF